MYNAGEFNLTEGHTFISLPQSVNSLAVNVIGGLETIGIAGDHVFNPLTPNDL
jgi:hypothetical protein